jgi:hypothetical protein
MAIQRKRREISSSSTTVVVVEKDVPFVQVAGAGKAQVLCQRSRMKRSVQLGICNKRVKEEGRRNYGQVFWRLYIIGLWYKAN